MAVRKEAEEWTSLLQKQTVDYIEWAKTKGNFHPTVTFSGNEISDILSGKISATLRIKEERAKYRKGQILELADYHGLSYGVFVKITDVRRFPRGITLSTFVREVEPLGVDIEHWDLFRKEAVDVVEFILLPLEGIVE